MGRWGDTVRGEKKRNLELKPKNKGFNSEIFVMRVTLTSLLSSFLILLSPLSTLERPRVFFPNP
ncbi:MAG TPA: hypothetical protein VK203_20475 [Nostocaceae cyanobacterium]|nr:hypothetical protein [Nostocaceae cyanobacterium]